MLGFFLTFFFYIMFYNQNIAHTDQEYLQPHVKMPDLSL